MGKKIAVYPGTFDPITNGHVSIVNRALKIFDKLVIAILNNPVKVPLFTLDERIDMIKKALGKKPNIEVDTFDGLLVDYVVKKQSNVILRGLRALSDFSDGADEPKTEQRGSIHFPHDRLQMVLYKLHDH
jgi:pantetheine-phosphate adenylyltransferase